MSPPSAAATGAALFSNRQVMCKQLSQFNVSCLFTVTLCAPVRLNFTYIGVMAETAECLMITANNVTYSVSVFTFVIE